jgi:hypothetical protein
MAVCIVMSIIAQQRWGVATLSEQAIDDQSILLVSNEKRERRPAEVGSLVSLTSVEEVGVVGTTM